MELLTYHLVRQLLLILLNGLRPLVHGSSVGWSLLLTPTGTLRLGPSSTVLWLLTTLLPILPQLVTTTFLTVVVLTQLMLTIGLLLVKQLGLLGSMLPVCWVPEVCKPEPLGVVLLLVSVPSWGWGLQSLLQ